jgi:16S rRNA (cytosine967-C5)-methyltransferase
MVSALDCKSVAGKMTPIPQTSNSREAAYLALLASLREERFITDTLELWQQQKRPSALDFRFAQQIAYGSAQMVLALDYLAQQLSDKKTLSLKQKERALVRLALYQFYYLDRVPLYAIADEMLKIAHKYCHRLFVNYLNALMRKLSMSPPALPTGDSLQDLSVRYSYPVFYVQALLAGYGLEKAKEIMTAGNTPAPTMARLRPTLNEDEAQELQKLDLGGADTFLTTSPCSVAVIKDPGIIPNLTFSSRVYIQNVTPAVLIGTLSKKLEKAPKRILDLCASPGGKLVAAHDAFPKAKLYGNDVSEEKLKRLHENCQKYGIAAELSCSKGEEYASEELFDLIILDVPCSNSGVLNKRPEARWRLSVESFTALGETQLALIGHAKTLLAPGGVIWYMTCSILKKENEELVQEACKRFGLQVHGHGDERGRGDDQHMILPNAEGWDGGYACVLRCV